MAAATSDRPAAGAALSDEAYEALSIESATVVQRTSVWTRLARNWSVRIGGVLLALLVLIALVAPLLGTVDPALFDPGSRDLLPGAAGEIMTLEGDTLKHTFLMGSDSFGRDIYSRVLFGARVSLVVGIACAVLSFSIWVVGGVW